MTEQQDVVNEESVLSQAMQEIYGGENNRRSMLRTMVRGVYQIQKLRIQTGNRIAANFKSKLGLRSDGMKETELAREDKNIIDQLRASYKRITDGVVLEESDAVWLGKLPPPRKFKGDGLISTYAEAVLVQQYMGLLENEERQFKQMKNILDTFPFYSTFLENIAGVGPAMAAVLISEINPHTTHTSSALHKYCGVDVVRVGVYVDANGNEKHVPGWKMDEFYAMHDEGETYFAEGVYPVTHKYIGRSRREECLVKREYTKADGARGIRDSITFNPFLKTKLTGVLTPSFLKAGVVTVDGKRMGAAVRLKLAEDEGYKSGADDDNVNENVIKYLELRGHIVICSPSKYGECYYQYKRRLESMPEHVNKTPLHRHNMAIRYALKIFLIDYYVAARQCAGLPVTPSYAEAKLGLTHGQTTFEKQAYYEARDTAK